MGVAAIVTIAYALVMTRTLRDRHHGDYSGFLQISGELFDHNPLMFGHPEIRRSLTLLDNRGYDAQFMYYMTFDPLMTRFSYRPFTYQSIVDSPPYRYGRIGYSWLTRVIAGHTWRRYPPTMVWIVVASCGLCALLLALIAADAGASPAWGLLAAIVPGFWMSLQAALPEPLAAALLLGAYFFARRRRWIAAGACAAASLLVRETGVVLVLWLIGAELWTGRRRNAFALALVALVPVIAWRAYVGGVLWPTYHWQAFYMSPGDVGAPIAGIAWLWTQIAHGQYAPDLVRPGVWFPCLLLMGAVLAFVAAWTRPSAATIAAAFYATLAISLNDVVWRGVGNGVRGTYELFLTLALTTIGWRSQPKGLRAGLAVFWMCAALYVFALSDDAAFVRGAFLLP
jgi:hypothetical protein